MFQRHVCIVGWADARAIVLDLDGIQAIVLEADLDGGCAGVQAVLNQLFDNGAQIDDDLTRLDLVYGFGLDGLDRRHPGPCCDVNRNFTASVIDDQKL